MNNREKLMLEIGEGLKGKKLRRRAVKLIGKLERELDMTSALARRAERKLAETLEELTEERRARDGERASRETPGWAVTILRKRIGEVKSPAQALEFIEELASLMPDAVLPDDIKELARKEVASALDVEPIEWSASARVRVFFGQVARALDVEPIVWQAKYPHLFRLLGWDTPSEWK